METFDYAIVIILFTLIFFWLAWREHAGDNPRDARILAACGTGSGIAAVATLLI